MAEEDSRRKGRDLDRDPATGQPETHLGGMAGGAFAGATTGGLTGAAIAGASAGTIAGGPIGAVSGAVVGVVAGAVLGGIAGKALAERFNPEHENEYWRNEFPRRPYAVSSQYGWDDYWPAYRFGYEHFPAHAERSFDEVEPELSRQWEQARGTSRLDWAAARHAVRDEYERLAAEIRAANPQDRSRSGDSEP
jgi:hypothetical protein